MKRIRSAIINGKRHRIVWRDLSKEEALGLAYPDQCLIEIDKNLDEYMAVDALIHECLHKLFPDVCEDKIDQAGREIATILTLCDLIKEDE
jgi:hypothetical protein